ncbi:hypothetical protein [Rhodococcus sp. M8-35]|uniref:hypothetical protein n=1 Tax=Rhodococcus sp. M8-35 TaxID=3058401 RepID=UPI002ED32615
MRAFFVSIVGTVIVLAAAVAPATGAPPENPERVYENPWQPIEISGFHNCNGETVAITGEYLLRATTRADASGGTHVSYLFVLRGEGVGLTTGTRYMTNERIHGQETYPSSGTIAFTSTGSGLYKSSDPATPDLRYAITIHATIIPDGTMTSEVLNITANCD